MMSRPYILTLALLLSVPALAVSADTSDDTSVSAASAISQTVGAFLPAGLAGTSAGFSFEENFKPAFYLETVRPLYQDAERIHTVFLQPRVSYQSGDEDVYNVGVGYRRYLEDKKILAGVNAFGDFQRDDRHGRLGLGAEVFSRFVDARVNAYIGVTPRRLVEETAHGLFIYEKVADGLDAELGGPVPYLPWIKVFGGGRAYFYEHRDDDYGWKSRVELKPFPFCVLQFERSDLNGENGAWRADIRFTVPFERETKNPLPLVHTAAFLPVDPRDRALQRVEREHRLVKERFAESGGVTFFVAKA